MKILMTGISTRAMAESAVRGSLGHEIVTVDYFGDQDQKALCPNLSLKRDFGKPWSVKALFEVCRSLPFDALVYTSNLENHPRIVERLSQGRLLFGNPPQVLSRVRNPFEFFPCLARSGIPFPKTFRSSDRIPVEGPGPFLRKPIRSGGGHGIAFHRQGRRIGKGFILQEYVPGLQCSAAFVADGSQCVLLGLSEQLIGDKAFGAQGFRYCGSLLRPFSRGFEEIIAKLEGVLQTITREFHLVGVNGMDFILKEGEIYPVEVNPRYTASMELIERGYGLSIFDLHVEACRGKLPVEISNLKFEISKGAFFGKAILFARRDLFVKGTEGWWQKGVKDIPFEGDWIGKEKPICTIFAEGRNREECYGALVELARTLFVSFATSS